MAQIAAGQAAAVFARGVGMWSAVKRSARPEMSVTSIFEWMESAPYHLIQPPNMESAGGTARSN